MKRLFLDAADIRILSALQQHGQLSKAKLAEVSGLSATPCWARLGGGVDYIMKVISPSLATFQDLMEDFHAEDIGIDRYMTHFATRQVKSSLPNVSKLANANPK